MTTQEDIRSPSWGQGHRLIRYNQTRSISLHTPTTCEAWAQATGHWADPEPSPRGQAPVGLACPTPCSSILKRHTTPTNTAAPCRHRASCCRTPAGRPSVRPSQRRPVCVRSVPCRYAQSVPGRSILHCSVSHSAVSGHSTPALSDVHCLAFSSVSFCVTAARTPSIPALM